MEKEEPCLFCEGTGQVVSSTTISGFKTCDCINIPQEESKCTCKEHDPYCCQVHGSCPTCVKQEESKQELLPDFKITKNIFDFVTDLSDTKKEESTIESAKTDWDSLIGEGLDESLKEWDEPKKERKPWSFCETPEEKCTMNYCDENGCQNRERVLVEPKQETLEEEAKEGYNNMPFGIGLIKRRSVFLLGAKWQAERMYSDEEVGELVYNIIGEYGKHYGIMIDGAKLNELFEQFKKK
jgi:hypothetical protein